MDEKEFWDKIKKLKFSEVGLIPLQGEEPNMLIYLFIQKIAALEMRVKFLEDIGGGR